MKVENWNKLEELGFKYNEKTNKWYKGSTTYIRKESCKTCGKPFLSQPYNNGLFCDKKCSGDEKLTYNYVKEQIEKEGYKLLSKEYKGNKYKLNIKCILGHTYKVRYNDFQQGHRCPICFGTQKLTYNYVKEQIEKEGYKLLSKEYINMLKHIKVKCIKGHIYKVSYGNWYQGYRCPICSFNKKASKGEKEVLKYVKSIITKKVIPNDRTQIINPKTGNNLELDIWIPSLNKAIEYNGEYWHTFKEAIYKDYEKVIQCNEKDIDLLVINEQKWYEQKECCKELIKEFIER